jgi:hypothetical protein
MRQAPDAKWRISAACLRSFSELTTRYLSAKAINLFKSPHRVHSYNPLEPIISRMSDSCMDCRPALRVRFCLAQNFPGHRGNVALTAKNIVEEV